MAIDNLLAAILAMDAYNRGYSQAIAGLPDGGQVGDATIVADSTSSVPSSATDGFYGIEYSVNGQIVIAAVASIPMPARRRRWPRKPRPTATKWETSSR
jgi:hypothetical protein